MIESIDPRPLGAAHPLVPEAAIAAPQQAARPNPINGREQAVDPGQRHDLQFSCIFPLAQPLPCTAENAASCECNEDEHVKASPLCEYDQGSPQGGTQVYAKAYPSLRQLEVLRGVGQRGLVTSICPKNTTSAGSEPGSDPNHGYHPVANAITDLLATARRNDCIEAELPVERSEAGDALACPLVVVTSDCSCSAERGLAPIADSDLTGRVYTHLYATGCAGLPTCDVCLCEMSELAGDARLPASPARAPTGFRPASATRPRTVRSSIRSSSPTALRARSASSVFSAPTTLPAWQASPSARAPISRLARGAGAGIASRA
jgi:hypothetical protein